jgi:hypothetical protein
VLFLTGAFFLEAFGGARRSAAESGEACGLDAVEACVIDKGDHEGGSQRLEISQEYRGEMD